MSRKNTRLLGKILLDKGLISAEELQEVLNAQAASGNGRLGEILVKKGYVAIEDVLMAVAQQHNLKWLKTLEFEDSEGILKNLPLPFLKKNTVVPFKCVKGIVTIAVDDPFKLQIIDDMRLSFAGRKCEIVIAPPEEILSVIHQYFEPTVSETTDSVIEDLEESDFEILTSGVIETEDILDMANDAPIIRLVNTIIRQAVSDRASDIHFEPYEKELVVRFRIDGILYKVFTPPKKFQPAIISRVKIMANLNIAENRLPQDGRIQIKIGGKDIDIRVSVFPTYYGERIVLRLLNKTDMKFDLDSLGMDDYSFDVFKSIITKTHGIVMVTGPTGSGKSTTLYSVLMRLNNPDVNILTVEDPIEYQLTGVGQMQVKPKIDLTFAAGLRSILRQDPDIIMIGEIRDLETAEIAVQAALTGHRVFSTLHTNDAASGITRLIDMGVEPFLIASSVNAFIAQRLVRVICPHCKTTYKPTPAQLSDLGLKPSALQKGMLYQGKGCEKCLNTGYAGRLGIYEILPVTSTIRKLILTQADASEIKEAAMVEGMKTLLQDGLSKAIKGLTTVEEVLRVS